MIHLLLITHDPITFYYYNCLIRSSDSTNGEFCTVPEIIQDLKWLVDYFFKRSITVVALVKVASINGEENLICFS